MLLRARVAALAIVLAPSLAVAADVLAGLGSFPTSSLMRLAELAAWLPAIATLEHFLKRRSEAGSLLCAALATLGALAGVVDVTFELASAGSSRPWIGVLARRCVVMLPIGIALFGAGYWRWRVAPPLVCLALIAGGALAIASPAVGSNVFQLAGHVLVLAACAAVASGIAKSEAAWRDATLWNGR